MTVTWLPVDSNQRTVLVNNKLQWFDKAQLPSAGPFVLPDPASTWGAARVPADFIEKLAADRGGVIIRPPMVRYEDYPQFFQAAGQLRNRDMMLFDPATGDPLHYPHDQRFGVTDKGVEVFPRTDPSVIGLVELEGENKLLIVRSSLRPNRWSVVSGYVENGETIEEAFTREVAEESGRRLIDTPRYLFNQPWPISGSLLFAMRGTTRDRDAVMPTDGELIDMRWVTRDELRLGDFELPAPGSVAGRLMRLWRDEQDK